MTASSVSEAKRCRTLVWIVSLCTVGLMFDGYDLVVYGTVVSTFLRDPSQIAPVDPALAGTLGSYALLGVLVGALLAGSIGDMVGRRNMILGAYA
jgi:MFS transporter, AAHS family, benzoate transport protein